MQGGLREPVAGITGIYAWYDFADSSTLTLNTTYISKVRDKSGNGKDVSQATALNQPTLESNAQNSKSAAKFYANQWLTGASAADWQFLHAGPDKSMLFVVLRTDGEAVGDEYMVLGTQHLTASNPGIMLGWSGTDALAWSMTGSTSTFSNIAEAYPNPFFGSTDAYCIISTPTAPQIQDRLFLAWQDNRNATGTWIDYDGEPGGTAAYPLVLGRAGLADLTGWYATPLGGIICEVLVYKRATAFSAAERSLVFDYLVAKWAL